MSRNQKKNGKLQQHKTQLITWGSNYDSVGTLFVTLVRTQHADRLSRIWILLILFSRVSGKCLRIDKLQQLKTQLTTIESDYDSIYITYDITLRSLLNEHGGIISKNS